MIVQTSSGWAPWHVVDNDDKKRGRLNIITHLLGQIPFRTPGAHGREDAQAAGHSGYVEPESSQPNIPTPF